MSVERFEVPEPSNKAVRAAVGPHPTIWPDCLERAYAVDVPAIVRAEVERALVYLWGPMESERRVAYLAARRVVEEGKG